ncbi:hypothetical protein SAMN04489724_0122 [Algoriphagus locisalis]|uniref:DUF3945 domain-containing protein n=1 Tax=Algoriphagus locisalis TaxID=305507 RepID=A0A1I7E5L2_9BACT|nr:hypothetical protein [Algoriphagus locisalis]SFU19228.1 hypothetical protein SAMN04489724_0122 [Algoriphagus locisalis]
MTIKENIQELQDRLKYSGFGETLNKELEKQVKAKKSDFELNMSKEVGDKKLDYGLHFRKSDEGRYYYNGFDAKLSTPEGKEQSQRFYNNQGVSAKEALNLLEGRAVFKSLFNKEGERYNAWLQLDLGSKDEKGQHPVTQYHQNYGFKLEDAVQKLPLNNMGSPDQLDLLLYSLKKGNRHEVDIIGNDSRFLLEANPKYKTMNVYNVEGKRLKISDLNAAQDQVKAEAKKIPEAQRKSKGVKV